MISSILLCFVHGFKGDEDTFYDFPQHLKETIGKSVPDLHPDVVVYPKYETKGDLPTCVGAFREWLIGQVMVREKAVGNERPQTEPTVGVFFVAHSMGGLVAADTLLSLLDDGPAPTNTEPRPLFPAIQGVLAFDTPFAGLSRSMFAYGAFAQYRTISSAYGLVTSVSAIPTQMISKAGTSGASSAAQQAGSASYDSATENKPAWKLWQTLAMRTGATGAIAAAGAAAYMNRENIGKGLQYMNKDDIGRGLSSVNLENIKQMMSMVNKEQIQQGFAYMSRENIGQGFGWLSSHLQFVRALMRGQELQTRIERLSAMEGVGFADLYTSLGANDTWGGSYFVAERTFCAIPAPDTKANKHFIKEVNPKVKDEIEAHLSMFSTAKNPNFDEMSGRAAGLIMNWAKNNTKGLVDHYRLNNPEKQKFNSYTYSTGSGLQELSDADKLAKGKSKKGGKQTKSDKDSKTQSEETAGGHTKYTYGTSGFNEWDAQGKRSIAASGESSPTTSPATPASETQQPPVDEASTLPKDPVAQAGPPEEEDLDLENVPGVTEDLEMEKDEESQAAVEDERREREIQQQEKEQAVEEAVKIGEGEGATLSG